MIAADVVFVVVAVVVVVVVVSVVAGEEVRKSHDLSASASLM